MKNGIYKYAELGTPFQNIEYNERLLVTNEQQQHQLQQGKELVRSPSHTPELVNQEDVEMADMNTTAHGGNNHFLDNQMLENQVPIEGNDHGGVFSREQCEEKIQYHINCIVKQYGAISEEAEKEKYILRVEIAKLKVQLEEATAVSVKQHEEFTKKIEEVEEEKQSLAKRNTELAEAIVAIKSQQSDIITIIDDILK